MSGDEARKYARARIINEWPQAVVKGWAKDAEKFIRTRAISLLRAGHPVLNLNVSTKDIEDRIPGWEEAARNRKSRPDHDNPNRGADVGVKPVYVPNPDTELAVKAAKAEEAAKE